MASGRSTPFSGRSNAFATFSASGPVGRRCHFQSPLFSMKKITRGGAAVPAASAARPWRNGCSTTAPAPSVTPLRTDRRSIRSGVTILGILANRGAVCMPRPPGGNRSEIHRQRTRCTITKS